MQEKGKNLPSLMIKEMSFELVSSVRMAGTPFKYFLFHFKEQRFLTSWAHVNCEIIKIFPSQYSLFSLRNFIRHSGNLIFERSQEEFICSSQMLCFYKLKFPPIDLLLEEYYTLLVFRV